MRKQMEGDNRERRKAAHASKQMGHRPSEDGITTGASKQRTHLAGDGDHEERLAMTQRGEAKQAGPDVPRPLRGKGRRNDPLVPPGFAG
jgi:hypothetical protein